jgi:hypothetical protein
MPLSNMLLPELMISFENIFGQLRSQILSIHASMASLVNVNTGGLLCIQSIDYVKLNIKNQECLAIVIIIVSQM